MEIGTLVRHKAFDIIGIVLATPEGWEGVRVREINVGGHTLNFDVYVHWFSSNRHPQDGLYAEDYLEPCEKNKSFSLTN